MISLQTIRKAVLVAGLGVMPLRAASIDLTYSDLDTATANIEFRFRTKGNGGINTGLTRFNPSSGDVTVSETTTYSYLIPFGSSISEAWLDFDALFQSQQNLQHEPASAFFVPGFASSPGAQSVTISAGLITATFIGLNGRYDLLPLFQTALLANTPITVSYNLVDHFTADTSAWDDSVDNGDVTFKLTETFLFSASEENGLHIGFAEAAPEAAPEPGSLLLAGLGLAAVAAARFRKR